MTLKEQIPADFETTFLNAGEFARICDWNGKPLKIVESAALNTDKKEGEGVSLKKTQVICNLKDSEIPRITEEILFDGKEWIVSDVKKETGHIIINLERRAA